MFSAILTYYNRHVVEATPYSQETSIAFRALNISVKMPNLTCRDSRISVRCRRMVNWDPKALTALSDEEVIYKEEHSKLYYLKYYVADDDMSGETGAEGEPVITMRA